jgi:hypothetical protein
MKRVKEYKDCCNYFHLFRKVNHFNELSDIKNDNVFYYMIGDVRLNKTDSTVHNDY